MDTNNGAANANNNFGTDPLVRSLTIDLFSILFPPNYVTPYNYIIKFSNSCLFLKNENEMTTSHLIFINILNYNLKLLHVYKY